MLQCQVHGIPVPRAWRHFSQHTCKQPTAVFERRHGRTAWCRLESSTDVRPGAAELSHRSDGSPTAQLSETGSAANGATVQVSPEETHSGAVGGSNGRPASAASPATSTPPAASTEGLSRPAAGASPLSGSGSEEAPAQGQHVDNTGGSSHKQHAVADAAADGAQDQPAAGSSGELDHSVAGTIDATGGSQKQPLQPADPAARGAEQAAAAGTAAASRQEQTPAQRHQAAGGKDSKGEPRRRPQGKKAAKKRKAPAREDFVEKVRGIRDEDRVVIPAEEVGWLRQGATVVGRVEWCSHKGALVALVKDPRITSFVPMHELPFFLTDDASTGTGNQDAQMHNREVHLKGSHSYLPQGLVREWAVVSVPAELTAYTKGPRISAARRDRDLMTWRMRQLRKCMLEEYEVVKARAEYANKQALMIKIGFWPAFIPLRDVADAGPEHYVTKEECEEKYVGNEIEVGIQGVDTDANTRCSMKMAEGNRYTVIEPQGRMLKQQSPQDCPNTDHMVLLRRLRQSLRMCQSLKVGSLVHGHVRRLESFGAFIGIDNTSVSALLHISNISSIHINQIEDVLLEGDRVSAIVIDINGTANRISLSTKVLEVEPGDMIEQGKEAVFAGAEAQAVAFNEWLSRPIQMPPSEYTESSMNGQGDSESSPQQTPPVSQKDDGFFW